MSVLGKRVWGFFPSLNIIIFCGISKIWSLLPQLSFPYGFGSGFFRFFQAFLNKKLETNQRKIPGIPPCPRICPYSSDQVPSRYGYLSSIVDAFLGCSHSITAPCLTWYHWCPTMPICEASWGTPAHTGDIPLISVCSQQLPEGFCSEEQHRANLSPWLQALNRVQLGRINQDQDFHHIPSPLPGGKRHELFNSKRRRLAVSCYWFGTGASSAAGKTWSLLGKEKGKGQKFSLDFFP